MTDAGELHRTQPKYGKGPVDLVLDPTVSDGAVRQFIYMHWRYGKNKQNFEGRESIAAAMHVSERTVTNRCAELEAAGWLVITRKSANKTTRNFYDVFEATEDCVAWRLENNYPYVPKKKQTPRKLRVGVGGQPTHAEKETSNVNSSSGSYQVANLNSSSLTNVNSSSLTNMNSSSGDLDSVNQTQVNQKESADLPDGSPQVPPPEPDESEIDPVPEKASDDPIIVQPHIAIIDAWYDGMPALPIERKYPRHVKVAKKIFEAGYTPEQVKACTQAKYAKTTCPDTQIKLEWIEEDLPLWLKSGGKDVRTNSNARPDARPRTPARPPDDYTPPYQRPPESDPLHPGYRKWRAEFDATHPRRDGRL